MHNKQISFTINTDGGSRGNPGPAAIGIVIRDATKVILHEVKQYIGIKTNNFAEYTAVKEALSFLQNSLKEKTCEAKAEFILDSELVVRQLTGAYKVKDPTLLGLYQEIKKMQSSFKSVEFTHVRREFNKEADVLVNKALDEIKNS